VHGNKLHGGTGQCQVIKGLSGGILKVEKQVSWLTYNTGSSDSCTLYWISLHVFNCNGFREFLSRCF